MGEYEKTTRSRGEHLKKNKVKTEIIRYILSKKDIIPGPEIIKYLRNNFNIVDEKNIRIHLRDLQKQHCIEKIPHEPGLDNKWKIEKIDNLRNIREHYPDIQLNTYDKSINIVLEEQIRKGYLPSNIHSQEFRVQLSLSVSFFNKCLEKDIKTICDTAYKMYQYGEGFEEYKRIQNYIEMLYTNYIQHISVSPKIWLDVYNENINAISEVEIYLNFIKSLPNVEVSEKTFREIFENTDLWRVDLGNGKSRFVEEYAIKMADMINQKMLNKISTESKKWEYDLKASSYILEKLLADIPHEMPNVVYYALLKELSVKISYEIFQKMFKEIPSEFLDIPDNICKILTEVLIKIFQRVIQEMQDSPEEIQQYEEEMGEYEGEIEELILDMHLILGEIINHQHTIRFSIDQVMFEHYFHIDIEEGIDSDAERKYVVMMRNLQAKLKKDKVLGSKEALALDKFYQDYIEKYIGKNRESIKLYSVKFYLGELSPNLSIISFNLEISLRSCSKAFLISIISFISANCIYPSFIDPTTVEASFIFSISALSSISSFLSTAAFAAALA